MLLKKQFFTFTLLIAAFAAFAQTTFEGTVADWKFDPSSKMNLEYWNEDAWKNGGSGPIDPNGHFSFSYKIDHEGLYRLKVSNQPKSWCDFILNPSKLPAAGYKLNLTKSDLTEKTYLINQSKEDTLYAEFMAVYRNVKFPLDSLYFMPIDPYENLLKFYLYAGQVYAKNQNTFTGSVLARTLAQNIPLGWKTQEVSRDSMTAYFRSHALDMIPFNDPRVLYHYAFARKLNTHYLLFKKESTPAQYIDQIMTKSMGNDQVFAFTFRFMLEKMMDYKSEVGLSYLLENYVQDCTDNQQLPDATKNLIKALDHCKPGNAIENLNLPNLKSERIALSDLCAKNKITLIYFWRSNCSHCKEFKPELLRIYNEYKSKGVEVYAIGVDKEEADWRAADEEFSAPWKSVFLSFDSRKDFSKRFPVPSTPMIMAVGSDGKIIRRLIMRSQLEQALQEMLAEGH
jgi:thiol-disulfide isomerase/thioredoxin